MMMWSSSRSVLFRFISSLLSSVFLRLARESSLTDLRLSSKQPESDDDVQLVENKGKGKVSLLISFFFFDASNGRADRIPSAFSSPPIFPSRPLTDVLHHLLDLITLTSTLARLPNPKPRFLPSSTDDPTPPLVHRTPSPSSTNLNPPPPPSEIDLDFNPLTRPPPQDPPNDLTPTPPPLENRQLQPPAARRRKQLDPEVNRTLTRWIGLLLRKRIRRTTRTSG